MFEMNITSIGQGWLLCLLTSAMCLLGCLLITVDLLYQFLFPKLAARHPFHIQENSSFLIASLSLSSGSLIFTSMFKLLPELQEYFDKVENLPKNSVMVYLLGFYLLGICICGGLNLLIHFCTSESVVHCVHGDEEEEGEDHGDEESNDTTEHTQTGNNVVEELVPVAAGTLSIQDNALDETTALLQRPSITKKESLIDLSLKKLKIVLHKSGEDHEVGKCRGYDSFEKCVLLNNLNSIDKSEDPECDSSSDSSHNVIPASDGQPESTKHRTSVVDLHYCDLPSPENLLYFQQQFHNKHQNTSHEFIIQSPLIARNPSTEDIHHHHHHHHHHHDLELQQHEDHESHHHHHHHENQHHHHITTPLSRLLSIGLQTILAITLHKFPEGFIMYSTSQANPSLGLTIFLSLSIHNFVEGFTMCLPMYLALNSRIKLILISGLIGGLAQPFGALLGWLLFRKSDLKSTDTLNFLFGNLMLLTAGFLTIIGFQMFASSMAFGGTQRFVLTWSCIGIALIGSSYILIGDMEI